MKREMGSVRIQVLLGADYKEVLETNPEHPSYLAWQDMMGLQRKTDFIARL